MSQEAFASTRTFLLCSALAGGLALAGCGVDGTNDEGSVSQPLSAIFIPVIQTAAIPTSYISDNMNNLLIDTNIQITNTTGDSESFPVFRSGNCHPDQAAINDCIADVCDGLVGKALGQCRNSCTQQHQICSPVCSSSVQMSFIHWGEIIVERSLENAPALCTTATCPACATPTQVPSLRDSPLFIGPFTKTIDLGLGSFDVTCRINQWDFRVFFNLGVTTTSTGMTIHVPGTNASPAIDCSNSPDISASNLGLDVTFHPTVVSGAPVVTAEGALTGSFSGGILDVVVDVDAGVKSAAHDQLASNLNTASLQKQYAAMFTGLVGKFLSDNHLPPVVTLLSLTTTPLGLTVTYQ